MQPIAYQPGNSALHRTHPLVKAGWMVSVSVLLFLFRQWAAPLPVVALSLLLLRLSGLRLRGRRGARLLLLTSVGLAFTQLLFQDQGSVLARLGPLTLTDTGLRDAVYVGGRFAAVVLLSFLFVLSTDPNDLAYALMRAGLPYRLGFAGITALRLVPMFEQEAETVYQAQLARGIALDRRGPRRWLDWVRRLLMPVLSSALTKVDMLAVSMEGRGFGRMPHRTFLRTVPFTARDAAALVVLALVTVGGVALALQQ